MAMRFATKTALCLALSTLARVSTAHADSMYTPYYAEDPARDSYQFATPSAPMTNGTPTPTPIAVPGPLPDSMQPETPLFHFNNELWASAGTSFLNYKEAAGPIPDSEKGWLPSIALGVDYMTHSNLYLGLEGSDSFSNAHYNGAVYDANTNTYDIPYQGTTHENIVTGDAKVGQGFYAANNVMLIPYAEVGIRYWDRSIDQAQTEDYHNFDILGGLKLEVTPIDRLILAAYASGGTTIGGKMETDGTSFDLGSSPMEKVGGKIGYDLTHRFELFSTLDYDHFHYSHSPIVQLSDTTVAHEPGSFTNDTTVRVGIGYHFR